MLHGSLEGSLLSKQAQGRHGLAHSPFPHNCPESRVAQGWEWGSGQLPSDAIHYGHCPMGVQANLSPWRSSLTSPSELLDPVGGWGAGSPHAAHQPWQQRPEKAGSLSDTSLPWEG